MRPGTISARVDDPGQGVKEGLFTTEDDDREHHNLKGGTIKGVP
jgi:hypothetical protein